MPWTAWFFPLLALLFYGMASATGIGHVFEPSPIGIAFAALLIPILSGAVFAAVYHAEVIAHRTGEPYGTLVLTIAVTVIELALIGSVMLTEGGSPTLARDTVYAVVMIICTGLVGMCIFIGGLHHGEQSFRVTGASTYLAVLVALSALTLMLPNYTSTVPGPVYSASQLLFVSAVTLAPAFSSTSKLCVTGTTLSSFVPTGSTTAICHPSARSAAASSCFCSRFPGLFSSPRNLPPWWRRARMQSVLPMRWWV